MIQAFVNLVEKMIKLKTEAGKVQIQNKEASTAKELMLKKKKDRLDFPSLKAFKSRLNLPPAFLGKYTLV